MSVSGLPPGGFAATLRSVAPSPCVGAMVAGSDPELTWSEREILVVAVERSHLWRMDRWIDQRLAAVLPFVQLANRMTTGKSSRRLAGKIDCLRARNSGESPTAGGSSSVVVVGSSAGTLLVVGNGSDWMAVVETRGYGIARPRLAGRAAVALNHSAPV